MLVIALKWVLKKGNEAVLVSAVSRATMPLGIMYDVGKVRPILSGDRPVAIASGAGDPSIIE